jgi:hypothetical protein
MKAFMGNPFAEKVDGVPLRHQDESKWHQQGAADVRVTEAVGICKVSGIDNLFRPLSENQASWRLQLYRAPTMAPMDQCAVEMSWGSSWQGFAGVHFLANWRRLGDFTKPLGISPCGACRASAVAVGASLFRS